MERMGRWVFVVALLIVGSCGQDVSGLDAALPVPTEEAGQAVMDGTPDGDADVEGVLGRWTVDWGPLTVAAGAEDTRCVIRRLGNPGTARIGSIHNQLGNSSHHMIVYRTSDTEERPDPFRCVPFTDTLDPSVGAPLAVTQRAEETITLPPGVAFSLDEDQMIRIEFHYINLTGEEQEIQASSTFEAIPPEEFQHEADFLYIGNPDISIRPRSGATLGPTFFPIPRRLRDVNFFSITGHTHQWGTDMRVDTMDAPGGPRTSVYAPTPFLWDEPETVYHTPAFQVPQGGGFSFTCEWNNLSDRYIGFGESANDEMCFFWAYYYPSRGAQVCIHTDSYGDGMDICCPGDALCALIPMFLGDG
jgi:hypothetical protein